jgi:tight adherence protein B
MDGDFQGEKRRKAIAKGKEIAGGKAKLGGNKNKVADTLKEIERREKNATKFSLEDRIKQAGLLWTRQQFYMISVGAAFALAAIGFGVTRDPLFGLGGAVIGGFGLPTWILIYLKKRRLKQFLNEFPNAVDVIVRGVKSGLPLGDCLKIIAHEAGEPVRSEFRSLLEQQNLGLTLPEAVATLPRRVPLQEANFFAIVVEIQSKSGGNLSEILGNLSKVLRDRKKMAAKVQAMSTEAKSSAGIIAALPFIVAGLVYLSSPHYIRLLFVTETGKIILMGCAMMMMVGVAVMKKMINFDI